MITCSPDIAIPPTPAGAIATPDRGTTQAKRIVSLNITLYHSGLPEPYPSEHARLWLPWPHHPFMCHQLPYMVKQGSTSQSIATLYHRLYSALCKTQWYDWFGVAARNWFWLVEPFTNTRPKITLAATASTATSNVSSSCAYRTMFLVCLVLILRTTRNTMKRICPRRELLMLGTWNVLGESGRRLRSVFMVLFISPLKIYISACWNAFRSCVCPRPVIIHFLKVYASQLVPPHQQNP